MLGRVTAQAVGYLNITVLWARLLNDAVRWCGECQHQIVSRRPELVS